MKFVIVLSTECNAYPRNDYGYWTGTTYRVNGEEFPSCEPEITENTKQYSSKKRAESMAEKLYDRCTHVEKWSVETVG